MNKNDSLEVIENHFSPESIDAPLKSTQQFNWTRIMFACLMSFGIFSLRPSAALAAVAGEAAKIATMSATKKIWLDIFCGAAASIIAVNFVHPIDIIKVRLQTQDKDD